MSRLHVLDQAQPNRYRVIVHAPTPAGNNSAGVSWATALVNAGLARNRLAVGAGPGQITSAEAAQVTAGTVLEVELTWDDNPAWDDTQRLADLTARADQHVAAILVEYAARLKWFGAVVT